MDVKSSDLNKAYEEVYKLLTDLKHFIFSTIQLVDPETTAVLLSRELQRAALPGRSSLWLVEKGAVAEIASDGREIPPDRRRIFAIDSSAALSHVIGEQNVVWSVDAPERERLFPGFDSPTLFPIKWRPSALGFLVADRVDQTQRELFQFLGQYISLLLNISLLHKEVHNQKEELSELTGILFSQNAQLAALHKVGMEIAGKDDRGQICRIIASTAVSELGADRAAVLLLDKKTKELRVESAIGLEGIEGAPLGEAPDKQIRECIETGRITSYKSSPEALQLGGNRINEWGIFPFKGRNDKLGALVAEIGAEDISDSLAILVNHGAMILDTFMLMEEKAKMNELLTMQADELALANKRLEQLSVTDQLTGLFNRRHFQERLPMELSRATRHGRTLALLMIDIDHFKTVNDTFGHTAGDEVLKEVSRRIVKNLRLSDLVVRYGGEEIVVLLTDTGLAPAGSVAEHLRTAVYDKPVDAYGESIRVSISIGVAVFPSSRVHNGEDLYNEADKAMYRAKEAGRNRVEAAE
jgi:diguanylate cyclase (GGDEF)-like protein